MLFFKSLWGNQGLYGEQHSLMFVPCVIEIKLWSDLDIVELVMIP
jgi:hypothetical protein